MPTTDANSLRRAFTQFFVDRGHAAVASSPLIPTHPTAPMFTNAGMNQFVPYFLGEEAPPYPRATSIQKCVRLSGKHNDIDELGKTRRHLTFFEMLGNFSFGDYFKEDAIRFAWQLLTEVVGFDGDRLWITVHTTDDDAEAIWHDTVGVPLERIQRLDKDNFWEMGETGPCGPCSEIHLDNGPEWGDGGGPAHGGGDRYIEFWNLVFMQNFRHPDASLTDLPTKNVDTGGGLERWLMLLEGVPTVFDTDAIRPIIAAAEELTGHAYRAGDDKVDTALRVIGDHARSMSFLVADTVTPSNEGRGYVLRGVIRRAVRRAYQLGVERQILGELVRSVVEHMGQAYPELRQKADVIADVVDREEGRFRQTLRAGSILLDEELDKGRVSGEVAFKLHDTYGFPIEITAEIAEEREVPLDRAGFDAAMDRQRERSRVGAGKAVITTTGIDAYRQILHEYGPSDFLGYQTVESDGQIVAVVRADDLSEEERSDPRRVPRLEVFLDRTPFYAEGGGQVGDIGTITTPSGVARVIDTTPALPGLHRHVVEVLEGDIQSGQEAHAVVDALTRDATRRNHTGTHLLQAALREIVGPHVHQQGSYVGPDRLRFDLNHHEPLTPEQLEQIENLVNEEVLTNQGVRAYETTMDHARELGAMMFFGDKYGDIVRVVEAGNYSVELCGGTHVHALGTIGPLKITSEGSIGSNLRRIEAVTGTASLLSVQQDERSLERAAAMLRTKPDEVVEGIERLLQRQRELQDELKALRSQAAAGEARRLVAEAEGGLVVLRRDGRSGDELGDLAKAVRGEPGIRGVVLVGSPDGERVAIAVAVAKDSGLVAGQLALEAARACGGGANPKAPEFAVAGGKDVTKIDDAIAAVRQALGLGPQGR
ncbi:MAG TPA: alanine--tRNA ligase [Acidimicrobiales bacterium]|nr:alanine--tRNA ligase [Acidimicrobiales bacterium]